MSCGMKVLVVVITKDHVVPECMAAVVGQTHADCSSHGISLAAVSWIAASGVPSGATSRVRCNLG